ncbi:hypothetical protein [Pleurocapsa sp. CCALA 161]
MLGASGSGKSSVLRSGLVHQLQFFIFLNYGLIELFDP